MYPVNCAGGDAELAEPHDLVDAVDELGPDERARIAGQFDVVISTVSVSRPPGLGRR